LIVQLLGSPDRLKNPINRQLTYNRIILDSVNDASFKLLHKLTYTECEDERNLEKNSTGVSHPLYLPNISYAVISAAACEDGGNPC